MLCKLDCVDNSAVTNTKFPLYLPLLRQRYSHEHKTNAAVLFTGDALVNWTVFYWDEDRTVVGHSIVIYVVVYSVPPLLSV